MDILYIINSNRSSYCQCQVYMSNHGLGNGNSFINLIGKNIITAKHARKRPTFGKSFKEKMISNANVKGTEFIRI